MAWGGFPWARVQDVESLILVDALLPLDGGRRRERKKKEKRKRRKKLSWGRRVSLGLDQCCWPCGRSQLLGTIKS
jgi:hypothetical protein